MNRTINDLEPKLTVKGFDRKGDKKTYYYISDQNKNALVINPGGIPIIVQKEVCLGILDKNICTVPKSAGEVISMSMPCVYIGTRTYYLHQLPKDYCKGQEKRLRDYEAELQGREADHKNHNRFDNSDENIRSCTRSQNSMNQRCKLPVPEETDDGGYTFSGTIQCDMETLGMLEEKGYTVLRKGSDKKHGKYKVKSKSFADAQSCCQEARWFNDLRYGDFAYCPEEDFEDKMSDFEDGKIGEGTALLIRQKLLQEIKREEMIELNKERHKDEMYGKYPLSYYMH